MAPKKEELLNIIDKFNNTAITLVGDYMLDHYVWGKVDRISPEAPVVVVNVTHEDKRLGGAGNVARNLGTLGAKVIACGIVGDDQAGREIIGMLEGLGANTEGLLVDRNRNTIIKSRVIAHSQQVVRIDHETIKPLTPTYAEGIASAITSNFKESKGLIVSDYGKGTICPLIFERIQSSFKEISKQIPVVVDPKAPNFSLYKGVTAIKPNRMEASQASGINIKDRKTALEAGRMLIKNWDCEMLLITLGENGMVVIPSKESDKYIEVDTVAKEVFDVSGAGDTVTAVFTLALAVGATAEQAAYLANHAGGIVVAEVGTVAIDKADLIDSIKMMDN